MTAAAQPPVPRPVSPAVVFTAGFLLAGIVTAQIVSAVGSFYAIPYASRFYSDQAGDEADGQVAVVGLVLLAALSLLTALIYGILTPLTARGLNPARVLTWVVIGFTVVVCVVALVLAPYESLGWYRRLALITTLATLLFAVTSAVLLALPRARAYFRRNRRPPQPFVYRTPMPQPPYPPPAVWPAYVVHPGAPPPGQPGPQRPVQPWPPQPPQPVPPWPVPPQQAPPRPLQPPVVPPPAPRPPSPGSPPEA